ncbi:MAG: hypothetical protein JGK17_00480 [Microcoleus sp. PH2017_10_PVI_O_A]|uniref:hypothetical protein n=1 Tax=unclassified Microcoleus TaxID=2642155 RepID=UPI001E0C9CEC|nr:MULTISPECIES: hypothetical protein [unclassified Microcoleus]MCC3404095.1 hypothetical protein [Microcoleus sp. PH2017_10_PVI_O_A]MCC3458178.1 hypothetical protein [Microcoleus sp. PH2017_11_PCY_U_A]MCC3476600.1 hypothetical protein [Microcoleus sp. PH2017_12_PCY_D_A]MCC3527877.1 hypothetical protein [Microcoleus sp. PH2017_21_RUC_O_A]MCC3557574.1 hypothetical protein [Microcoleus sp. PH2017_27_LUM_O_A]
MSWKKERSIAYFFDRIYFRAFRTPSISLEVSIKIHRVKVKIRTALPSPPGNFLKHQESCSQRATVRKIERFRHDFWRCYPVFLRRVRK